VVWREGITLEGVLLVGEFFFGGRLLNEPVAKNDTEFS
jgi:hypothetical protein